MGGRDTADLSNVVRFPLELRVVVSIGSVGEREPDVREVLLLGDSLGLDLPAQGLRDRVDEETARYIAEQVLPLRPAEQRRALDGLLGPVLLAAIEACRSAAVAWRRSGEAAGDVQQARAEGGHWMESLEETADALLHAAACAMIEAHRRCQEAHGVGRAVGLARRGEAWVAYDAAETSAWLAEAGRVAGRG